MRSRWETLTRRHRGICRARAVRVQVPTGAGVFAVLAPRQLVRRPRGRLPALSRASFFSIERARCAGAALVKIFPVQFRS